jgi:prefoldin subunit 5
MLIKEANDMAENELMLAPRVRNLEQQAAELKGAIEQLNRSITAGNRMTAWQFIGFVFVMSGTLFGTLYWATGVLERRIEQSEKRVNERFDDMNKRFDDVNKRFDDVNRRIDDLRQIIISQRKSAPPQR